MYLLYWEKEVTKKSTQQYIEFNKVIKPNGYNIYEICNSKTTGPHRLLLNLSDKINLNRSDTHVALSTLSIAIHGKI